MKKKINTINDLLQDINDNSDNFPLFYQYAEITDYSNKFTRKLVESSYYDTIKYPVFPYYKTILLY